MGRMRTLILLLIFLPASARADQAFQAHLAAWGISFRELGDFMLKGPVAPAVGGISEVEATSGKRVLRITRIEGLGSEEARRYTEEKRGEITSMYDRRPDGYFPPQAKGQNCSKDMKPVLKERTNGATEIKALLSMANQRLVTGICIKEQAKMRLIMALAYCENQRVMFDVRYFSPLKGFSKKEENAVLSLTCVKSAGP